MVSLSDGRQAGVVGAFGAAPGFLGGALDVDGVYFDNMVGRVCPLGLRLGGANASGAGAAFRGLRLSVSGGMSLPGFVVGVAALVLGLSISQF